MAGGWLLKASPSPSSCQMSSCVSRSGSSTSCWGTGIAWLAEVEDKEMDMLGDVDSDSEGEEDEDIDSLG